MKKIITILFISVFIISLVGTVFAQQVRTTAAKGVAVGGGEEAPGQEVKSCVEKCREKGDVSCIAKCRAADIVQERKELIRADKFTNLSEAQKLKLQTLNTARLQRLEKLDAKQLKRINALEASNIRKLTALDEEKLKKIINLDEEKLKKLALLNIRELKAYSNLKEDQLKVKLDKLKIAKIKQNERFVKRQIVASRIKQLNTNYNLTKEEYVKARNLYRNNKEDFLGLKTKLKACQNATTEECDKLREEALAKAKEYVNSVADTLITHLEKIKNRIESSEALSENASAKAIEEIDNLINQIKDIKAKVDAAETKEELREAIKELNQLAVKVRLRAKIRAAGLLHDGVERLIKLAELAGEKADCSIAQLEEEGVDVTELETLLNDYYGKIEGAKEDFKKAKELLLSGTETAVSDAKEKIKEARTKIKEALKLMIELRQKIKDSGGKACQKAEIEIAEEEEVSTTELITEEVPIETEEETESEEESETEEPEGE